ncbi:MBL fold metallo-hydrolase [Corallococcus praedator]|uniref:MBL fold metallo-hydrolase n=1 Tax=Corallococcus praedator TaxID=2316724 RepID=A0ABX9QBG3_9BACT|nr:MULTISPECIES: MBL fold metallo-hydrolase [Corallococcus]RKH08938.1 MBL fold metallo-hydrolase [Corallococcus sp. CA047B]RKH23427.1 MBL fold metallo-hydrolase [Corallococcus sp. CA031C]RKH95477.1 MBL fold metallo-hydrolase [Corallococcus praedator]
MRIHHLNCGTLCPASARFVVGSGGLFERARMVCHCLLIESSQGLVLVDTGLGTRDLQDAKGRLGQRFLTRNAPRLDPAETALAQVERLGFKREDVRHIVPTHLDLDHVGGLVDFPEAQVHVFGDEHAAAMVPPGPKEKFGYKPVQWAHGPKWSRYAVDGERWFGFEAVRVIPGLDAEVLLVPLVGHTAGHCGVAVKGPGGWVLHAGDAYFNHREVDPVAPRSPWGTALFQRLKSVDNAARLANQERLRGLVRTHGAEVTVFSAHCAVEFDRHAKGPVA